MRSLRIKFENCYGIVSLDHEFDFTKKRQHIIYAPNGAMKSSFALTMKDHSDSKASQDRIYKDKETIRIIKDHSDADILPEHIFVVEPYSETYKSNRMSTLLANRKLRDRYDEVRKLIDEKKSVLLKSLSTLSGLKSGVEEALSLDITSDSMEFFKSLKRLVDEVKENDFSALSSIKYNNIFSPKVADLLKSDDFKKEISDYMQVYDRLVTNSTFFRKGAFNHNNAADVAKSLKSNGFFKANHSVYVNNKNVRTELKSEKDLEKVIQEEKDAILQDADLSAQFERIDKTLNRNIDLRDFRNYLTQNEVLIPELANPERLKQRLWISYLAQTNEMMGDLLDVYEKGRDELEAIVEEARLEATRWAAVLDEFNNRFSVPFVVTMENQHDVILKSEAPSIRFRFKNAAGDHVAVNEADLIRVLSNGEKRALYLLNIIFEVIARQEEDISTLFIFDDIADSFDYKNKYAIVEYLRDITEHQSFYQIILTHNYDFYRTVSSRLDLLRSNKLHTLKSDTGVVLKPEKYQNNPFKTWKEKLPNDANDDFLLAMIPFVRNIAEFSGNEGVENELTNCLHVKPESDTVKVSDLERIFKSVVTFKKEFTLIDGDRRVFDVLFKQANAACAMAEEEIELESKIILAMAIRIRAEIYMIKIINDANFLSSITKNQTFELLKKYITIPNQDKENISTMKQVVLMTPENIHINSFMFEPILDMSNHHLKRLHTKVSSLL